MFRSRKLLALATLSSVVLLVVTACGGSDDSTPTRLPTATRAPNATAPRLLTATPTPQPTTGPQATQIPQSTAVRATAEPGASPTPGRLTYTSPPPLTIDTSKDYFATFVTERGEFRLRLFDDRAPMTVNNFVFLARNGFYNGVTFHRVLDGFMAQGGDPTGSGSGGPGYRFPDEFHPDLTHVAGIISMANSGQPVTNGSQFFITFTPQHGLDGRHSVFGEVVEGMDVVNSLTRRDPNSAPREAGDVIFTIIIEEV